MCNLKFVPQGKGNDERKLSKWKIRFKNYNLLHSFKIFLAVSITLKQDMKMKINVM